MKDGFVPIRGYEKFYGVNRNGEVFSVASQKVLVPHINELGYAQVDLCVRQKHKYPLVHRLVADAFLPNPSGLPCVNHKDENRQNNTADNLEWCTYKYNSNYGNRAKKAKLHFDKAVAMIERETGEVVRVFSCMTDAEREFGYNHANVSRCCRGLLRSAYGYRWEFAKEV